MRREDAGFSTVWKREFTVKKYKVRSTWRKKAQILHLSKDGQGKFVKPVGQRKNNLFFFLNAFISFKINHCSVRKQDKLNTSLIKCNVQGFGYLYEKFTFE